MNCSGLVCWLPCRLFKHTVWAGLTGWLAGWLVGWLIGAVSIWLAGMLAIWHELQRLSLLPA